MDEVEIVALDREVKAAISRRPDIQAQWLAAMNAPHMTETAHAAAHLEAMDADKRAKLEGEW